MRRILLPFAGWLAVLQAIGPSSSAGQAVLRLITGAGMLAGFSVVFRAGSSGTWPRSGARDTLAEPIKALCDNVTTGFERIDRRLDAIDHLVAETPEKFALMLRRYVRLERRVERLEAELQARLGQ